MPQLDVCSAMTGIDGPPGVGTDRPIRDLVDAAALHQYVVARPQLGLARNQGSRSDTVLSIIYCKIYI